MADLARVAVLLVVLIDPISAAIGASALAQDRPERDRRTIIAIGAVTAMAVLAIGAACARPLLDALDISIPAAELAAGLVVVVLALDLLVQGPAGRVRPAPRAMPFRLGLFPYGIPLLAGPAALAALVAWAPTEGTATVIGAAVLASAIVAVIVFVWHRPPAATRSRALGGFTALATALVAFDLIRDGIFGT